MVKSAKSTLVIGSAFMLTAVLIGAFGAHGLEEKLTVKGMSTFKTGTLYHIIHALGLLCLGLIQMKHSRASDINSVRWTMIAGIVMFSFNCYLYAITNLRIFAMLVPIGGALFLVSWSLLIYKLWGDQTNPISR